MVVLSETRPMRAEGDRSQRARRVFLLLLLALAAAGVLGLTQGATEASLPAVLRDWLGGEAAPLRDMTILRDIRLPRLMLGILVGASLAVSGAVMQGLFRNPLADPGLVGVSSGAGLGAIAAIVLPGALGIALPALLGFYLVPLAAFCGGWAMTVALYAIATRQGRTSVATMLLAGIALGAMAGALSGLIVFRANDQQLRDLTFWGLGSLSGATWSKVMAAGPIILFALAATPFVARGLNRLTLGEAAALHMGTPVQRVKRVAILSVAAATGTSVAVSGGIGFVGIVVPHLLRLVIGPDHRWLLPCSALLGAALLVLADVVSRTVIAPAELPIGIVTAAMGAPFFLWILLRQRGVIDL
ncbi:iron ABC transporter permease [Haematobacter massiliensis]|uniref:Iron ABC transporter n=1 Tax=Haematobacter massiliensis TaxID=195105 RepID=A0A086YBJ7_9RHOB|nr:iron ABC transporter permease [Haematobacter massiliensis]KFI31647.1 iron ABC transporter [Haematobacter massiliensis]OWJ72038.1 iron ABC transporter permease [Haematobacter massiliensis]OWJ81542.1 iron ABC transporter permease [Haematobacter massiliensis]QBJ24043.1 iron ABC transporter permease [Haematobacter massiliensis]